MDIGYSGLKLIMIFKNIKFTLFIYNIRVKGLLNKRLNCHKKSFTFSFLLPYTTFQFDKGDQRQKQRQREDFQRHVKTDQRSTFCRHSTSSRRVKIRYKMRAF